MEGSGLIKIKNAKFMFLLSKNNAMMDAANSAEISRAHAARLLNEWVEKGWISRAPRKERRYEFTREGYEMLGAVSIVLKAMGVTK